MPGIERIDKKKKSLNPADAHRKELKRREKAKNQVERKKQREFNSLLNNPNKLEEELAKAQKAADENKLDKSYKAKVQELKSMLKVARQKQKVKDDSQARARALGYAVDGEEGKSDEGEGGEEDDQPVSRAPATSSHTQPSLATEKTLAPPVSAPPFSHYGPAPVQPPRGPAMPFPFAHLQMPPVGGQGGIPPPPPRGPPGMARPPASIYGPGPTGPPGMARPPPSIYGPGPTGPRGMGMGMPGSSSVYGPGHPSGPGLMARPSVPSIYGPGGPSAAQQQATKRQRVPIMSEFDPLDPTGDGYLKRPNLPKEKPKLSSAPLPTLPPAPAPTPVPAPAAAPTPNLSVAPSTSPMPPRGATGPASTTPLPPVSNDVAARLLANRFSVPPPVSNEVAAHLMVNRFKVDAHDAPVSTDVASKLLENRFKVPDAPVAEVPLDARQALLARRFIVSDPLPDPQPHSDGSVPGPSIGPFGPGAVDYQATIQQDIPTAVVGGIGPTPASNPNPNPKPKISAAVVGFVPTNLRVKRTLPQTSTPASRQGPPTKISKKDEARTVPAQNLNVADQLDAFMEEMKMLGHLE